MSEPFVGSVEILTYDHQSRGIPGDQWTPEAVPAVVAAIAGVTALVDQEPEPQASGRTPEAQWAGTDAGGASCTVLLWRQQSEDLNPPLPPVLDEE